MATSHGSEPFVPGGPTHNKGYEPDEFGVLTILAVPAAVIATALIMFVITWVLFANIFDPRIESTPGEIQMATDRNKEPLNDRMARISSTDPNAEVNAPRLEGMKRTTVIYRDGDKDNKKLDNVIDAEMTTTKPLKDGNSPYYHPEDLRPERSPVLTKPGLTEGGLVRMSIDKAMELLAAKGDARPLDWDYPKESNGGTGSKPPAAKPVEKKPEEKKEPEKK